jgi:hypothetical protein
MNERSKYSPEVLAILARLADAIEFCGADIKLDDVNVQGILGDTPLHLLAVSGSVQDGRILLDAGQCLRHRLSASF